MLRPLLPGLLAPNERNGRVQAQAMAIAGDQSAAGLVIVIVDDDAAVRNSLEFSLEIEGLIVHSYASGAELLADQGLSPPDCLVVDQKLSGMSGLELIGRLREERHLSAPAILITSNPSLELRLRAERAGVPIVEKPLLGNTLLEMIRDVVDGRGN